MNQDSYSSEMQAMSLFKNYLRSAFRNLARIRVHSLINITGLAIGLICFIIIMLYVGDERSYDRYNSKAGRIYRITSVTDFEGVAERSSSCPAPLGPTLVAEYPGLVDKMTRVFNRWSGEFFVEIGEKGYRERRFFFVDSTFTDIFDVNFVAGNPSDALSAPFTAIITESTANRYFGTLNAIGKTFLLEGRTSITVTGVISDTPPQSHFHYDVLVSMSTIRMLSGGKMPETWVYNPFWTYVLLHDPADASYLKKQLPGFTKRYFYDAEKEHITLGLQPLTDIHLKSGLDYEIEQNGNIAYVRILTAIAIFMLLIACINYINLSTAFAFRRSRETAVRKVSGATGIQLIIQYLGESLLLSFLAIIIALAAVELILPFFNTFSGKEISTSAIYSLPFLRNIILLWIGTGLMSGVYPALYQAGFNPVSVLKGNRTVAGGGSIGRKILVVVQFSLSIMLITASMMAFDQLNYLRNANLGFQKENIIILPVMRSPVIKQYDAFKGALLQKPGIEGVTAVDYIVGTDHNNHEFRPEGYPADKWQFYPALVVRDDFVKVFGIKIAAGRNYHNNSKADAMNAILINESMVKHLGWKSNTDAIGKQFHSRIGNEHVVGVFKDFNASSLHSSAGPLVLNLKEDQREIDAFTNFVAIKTTPGMQAQAIAEIEKTWNEFVPGRPFEFRLLTRELDKLYREEEYLGKSAAILSVLTIVIAALGLFGLVSFMAAQRTREIGIRKVLGAGTFQIVRLLTTSYLKLIMISIALAWPLAYLVINRWFAGFAYQTAIKWEYFAISGAVSIFLTVMITGQRALRSSAQNPSITLKYE